MKKNQIIIRGGVSPDDSCQIKAIALLMMLYHHLFGFPERLLIDNPYFEIVVYGYSVQSFIASACKLCVCVFAFLSGYGLFYSFKNKNLKERMRKAAIKSVDIYLIYLLSLLFVSVPLELVFKGNLDVEDFLLNVVMARFSMLKHSWYVLFYIVSVWLLAISYEVLNRNALWLFGIFIGVTGLIGGAFRYELFLHYFPSLALGFVFSKYDVYQRIWKMIKNQILFYLAGGVLLLTLCMVKQFVFENIGPLSMVTIIAPLLVWELKLTVNLLGKVMPLEKILCPIAKYSVFYWMLHAVVHNDIPQIQRLVYFPWFPVLIIIWSLILMMPISILLYKFKETMIARLRPKA